DPRQVRDISMDWPARLLDQRAGPKSAGYVVQYLGVELLPTEPGALVLAYDLMQKRRREVGPIVVCRAARDHRGGVGDQLADDFDRLRRRGDNDARIRPKPQPEHQHVPRLWIPPGGYFITPRCIVLRPPQALRLVGAVGCRNGPVRRGQQTPSPMRQDADRGHDKGDVQSGGYQGRRVVALDAQDVTIFQDRKRPIRD